MSSQAPAVTASQTSSVWMTTPDSLGQDWAAYPSLGVSLKLPLEIRGEGFCGGETTSVKQRVSPRTTINPTRHRRC